MMSGKKGGEVAIVEVPGGSGVEQSGDGRIDTDTLKGFSMISRGKMRGKR